MSHPTRDVKCQICDFTETRYFGSKGILVDPCPECGARMTYAMQWAGDQSVTGVEQVLTESTIEIDQKSPLCNQQVTDTHFVGTAVLGTPFAE